MIPCYWRLYYADDSIRDESGNNESILRTRPGALVLVVMQQLLNRPGLVAVVDVLARQPLVKVELTADGRMWRPIWYRNRSMRFDLAGSPTTDCLVFGRGTTEHDDKQVHVMTQLWATYDGQHIIDCPQEEIREGAIDNCVLGALA